MPTADVDVHRILTALDEHDVIYVVVGGFALELWDVAVPPTRDIDITPSMEDGNLDRLGEALNELDARLRVSGSDPIPIPGGFRRELLRQMSVLNLSTVAGPLDLTILPAGTEGYPDLATDASDIDYEGIMVPTASLTDVLRSKEAAGREKDFRTIPAIQAHLGARKAGNDDSR